MVDYEELRARVQKQAEKAWDVPAIEAWFKKLTEEGIPKKRLNREEIIAGKEKILERVQQRGEECEFMSHSCAKGAALPVMEEFGLGNMEIIKALSPFPGLGLTGRTCGAVSGGLVALGLYFGSDDLLDNQANRAAMTAARKFQERFEEEMGAIHCEDVQALIFGHYLNPWENSEAFRQAKGFEKCSLVAGTGARLAAEIIIGSMEESRLEEEVA
jgi:C_GCAxxG_C_C family probable redox protein